MTNDPVLATAPLSAESQTMNDEEIRELLPWVTPRLDHLGSIDDVHSGGGQGDVDGDYEPAITAS